MLHVILLQQPVSTFGGRLKPHRGSPAGILSTNNMCALHVQILEYHVVPEMSLSSAKLTDGQMLQTSLPGQSITVSPLPALSQQKCRRRLSSPFKLCL